MEEEKREEMNELEGSKNSSKLARSETSLASLQKQQLSLGELRLFCAAISKMNKDGTNQRTVTITRKEYEQTMELQRVNLQSLKKCVHDLQGETISYKTENGIVNINLFQSSEMSVNEYGEACIRMEFTEKAKEWLLDNMKQYKCYKLKMAASLPSKYAINLYFHVLQNSEKGKWTVSVEDLKRDVFHIDDVETYKEFKYFREKVLKQAVEIINQYTDCHIEYELNKKGRYVVAITFYYKPQQIKSEDKIEPDHHGWDSPKN